MSIQFFIRKFQDIVDTEPLAKQYFTTYEPKIYAVYLRYIDNRGMTCTWARAALKALWAAEMGNNGGRFSESLRQWGYFTD